MRFIKTYESKVKKVFYLISTKDLSESFYEISISRNIKDEILDNAIVRKEMMRNDYIYFGLDGDDWGWQGLEEENEDGIFYDGDKVFLDEGYKFAGYDNLTPKELKEVKMIKKNIELKNATNKYNI